MKTLLFLYLGLLFLNEKPFQEKFKYDIEKADNYFSDIKQSLKSSSVKYNNDYKMMSAVIYPELIRYSIFEDFFVIKVLESLYLQGGCNMADHSIGKFQMKPSFAEKLEHIVLEHSLLFQNYIEIASFDSDNLFKIREERLKRLNTSEWQIVYLNCFFSIMEKRFPGLKFTNNEQKLRFYATAYNHGFDKTKEEIITYSHKKCFPKACDCESMQYNYADVSVYFYKKIAYNE